MMRMVAVAWALAPAGRGGGWGADMVSTAVAMSSMITSRNARYAFW
jgi:hypothetical protein